MRILMLYSDISNGVADYTEYIRDVVFQKQQMTVVNIKRMSCYTQEAARKILSNTLTAHDHEVLHIQYDSNMLATDKCPYEQLENFVWLVNKSLEASKRVVVTFHGVPIYTGGENFVQKLQVKILHRYWKNKVISILKRCNIVVHTQDHKNILLQLGCDTNVHVIPSGVTAVDQELKSPGRRSTIKLVVPGIRSNYKNYLECIKLLSGLPENYHLYISDDNNRSDAEIGEYAHTHDVLDRLHLVSFNKDKSKYLKQLSQYDMAVFCYTENVPSSGSLNDCLSIGMPCYTNRTPSFEEINNQHACLLTGDNFNLCGVLLIRRLFNDVEYYNQLKLNIAEFQASHSPARVKKDMLNIYAPSTIVSDSIDNTINIFMCCRDNQNTLKQTLSALATSAAKLKTQNVRYYIFENDSVDDTPHIIESHYKTSPGKYRCDKFNNIKWSSSPGAQRMRDMAKYRNMMKQLCTDWSNSKYSFIVDSEILFDESIMSEQIDFLNANESVAMVTPYGTVGDSDVYYDQFAYRDMQDMSDVSNVQPRVKSAFGGFVCIRTPVLQRCDWSVIDGDTSEHVPFCQMVRRFGEIAIDRKVKVKW